MSLLFAGMEYPDPTPLISVCCVGLSVVVLVAVVSAILLNRYRE